MDYIWTVFWLVPNCVSITNVCKSAIAKFFLKKIKEKKKKITISQLQWELKFKSQVNKLVHTVSRGDVRHKELHEI